METKDKIINFLGDSITAGAGASTYENVYHQIMKDILELKKVNIYGISGTRIAKQHIPSSDLSYDKYFSSRIDDMDNNADIIIVFGGTNDYGHGDAEIGKMTDRTPDTFYGAVHDLLRKLIEKYPLKQIIVLTPLHRKNEDNLRGEGNKTKDYADLKTYVNIIKEVAEYYSIAVCDLYSISGIQPNVPVLCELLTADGLHPNDTGHMAIAKIVSNFLKNF